MNTAATAPVSVIESWTPPVHRPRRRHLQLVRESAPAGPDEAWVRRLTQSVVEVLGGRRSATTLVRALSPAVFQSLREPGPHPQLREGKVLSVRTQPLGPDSIEVAAVIGCPERTRAIALRLQQRHQRWRCVCVVVL